MLFVLGSKSALKEEAVWTAMSEVYGVNHAHRLVTVDVPSGVNVQPIFGTESWKGAHNRAIGAKAKIKGDVYLGVESGVYDHLGERPVDCAHVVLVGDNFTSWATTYSFDFPADVVREAWGRGFDKCTVGDMLQERYGVPGTDPHLFLSDGKVSRIDYLVPTLAQLFRDMPPLG